MLSFLLIIFCQIKFTSYYIRLQHYVFKHPNQNYFLYLKEEFIKKSLLDNGDFQILYQNA
jgi:hypothetical protein